MIGMAPALDRIPRMKSPDRFGPAADSDHPRAFDSDAYQFSNPFFE
jgi:hypothetical protein